MLLQYYAPDGSAPIAVALKVMDCSQDDACSFERVYNEVGVHWYNTSLNVLHSARCAQLVCACDSVITQPRQ